MAILVSGFASSLPASSYNPLTQGAPALTTIESNFDPKASQEPPGCASQPNLTATLRSAGALILPFSYNGVHLVGPASAPSLTVASYPTSMPSTTLPQAVAPALASEVDQVQTLWPKAHVVVVGHSEGGYVAQQYFLRNFDPSRQPEVRGIFSLDSPINGVRNGPLVMSLLNLIKLPASPALLAQFQSAWNNAPSNDAAILAKEGKAAPYVAVGTANDNLYRIVDDPVAGLTSQLLVGAGRQPITTPGSPNLVNPAAPPIAGVSDPLGVLASHDCVMGSAAAIKAVADRL